MEEQLHGDDTHGLVTNTVSSTAAAEYWLSLICPLSRRLPSALEASFSLPTMASRHLPCFLGAKRPTQRPLCCSRPARVSLSVRVGLQHRLICPASSRSSAASS